MAYATQDILDWAAGSQPLAFIGELKKKYFNRGTGDFDEDLHTKIMIEREILQWQFDQDPTDSDELLFGMGNYVYALCFPYVLEAMEAQGGGSVVVPGTGVGMAFPFVITSADFESDGVTYINQNIANIDLMIFINEWTQQWLFSPTSFVNVGNGIQIALSGFDANTFDYTIVIQRNNTQ